MSNPIILPDKEEILNISDTNVLQIYFSSVYGPIYRENDYNCLKVFINACDQRSRLDSSCA